MKLPRDLSGSEVARLLERHYGYRVARTKGSHMTLESVVGGRIHHVTVPRHTDIRVGREAADSRVMPVCTARTGPAPMILRCSP